MEGASRVIAIERDERCVRALADLAAAFPGRLDIVAGDALEIDAGELARAAGRTKIVANLPYNIATPLLLAWLADATAFESLTLMLQKEVAERLAAVPRTKAYGRLSVMCQWRCEVKMLFDVPARAFTPPPKVTSSVVHLTPRREPLAAADPDVLEKLVAAAFGQRRKMLRAALKSFASGYGADAAEILESARVAPTARAEELGVAEFCALARAFARLR
jgi:16S rRNA (adenine1518-N6/adenine1519-N6)-dimethyltransferase